MTCMVTILWKIILMYDYILTEKHSWYKYINQLKPLYKIVIFFTIFKNDSQLVKTCGDQPCILNSFYIRDYCLGNTLSNPRQSNIVIQ